MPFFDSLYSSDVSVPANDWPWESQQNFELEEPTLDLSFPSTSAETAFPDFVSNPECEFGASADDSYNPFFPGLRGRLSNAWNQPIEQPADDVTVTTFHTCPVCHEEVDEKDEVFSEHVHACFFVASSERLAQQKRQVAVSQQKLQTQSRNMIQKLRNTIACLDLAQRIKLQESFERLARGASKAESDAKTLDLLYTKPALPAKPPRRPRAKPTPQPHRQSLSFQPSSVLVHTNMQRSASAPTNIRTDFTNYTPVSLPLPAMQQPVMQQIPPMQQIPSFGPENLKVDVNTMMENVPVDPKFEKFLFSNCTTPVTFPDPNSPPPELEENYVNMFSQSTTTTFPTTVRNLKRQRDQGEAVPIVQALPFSPRASKLLCL